jgi:Tol biopolymer transport system component
MDIFVMEIESDGSWSAPRKLTDSKGQNAHAHFSPDGEWVVYTTEDYGISDEEPLVQTTIFAPQMYGEIVALRTSDGKRVRLTHNKWEDGTPIWTKGY